VRPYAEPDVGALLRILDRIRATRPLDLLQLRRQDVRRIDSEHLVIRRNSCEADGRVGDTGGYDERCDADSTEQRQREATASSVHVLSPFLRHRPLVGATPARYACLVRGGFTTGCRLVTRRPG